MATAAQPITGQDQTFDPLGELRKRYPGIAQEPDEKVYHHLSNPENFRSAFPEYAHLNDEQITRNMAQYAPSVTPKPEGAISRFFRNALGAAGLPESISDIPNWARRMTGQEKGKGFELGSPKDIGAPVIEPVKKAVANPTEENVVGAVPFLGPASVQAAQRFKAGDIAGGAGSLVGAAAPVVMPIKAPEIAKGLTQAGETVKPIARPIAQGAKIIARPVTSLAKRVAEPFGVGVEGEALLKKGVAPYAKQTGYDAAVKTAGDDIVRYHKETPIENVKDLDEALPKIQNKIMSEEVNSVAAKHAAEELPAERVNRVRAAVKDSLSPFAQKVGREVPKEVQTFLEELDKAHTVEDLIGKEKGDRGGALGDVNSRLESYFNKYPSARRGDLMKNPETAGWEAARRSLREETVSYLEDQGESGVREARQRWGALEELRRATERRINVSDRAKPMSLSRTLGLVAAPVTGGASVILGEIANYLNKPDVLVRRGIEKMAAKPLTVKAKALPPAERPPAIPLSKRPPGEVYQRPIETPPGAGKAAAPAEMHPDELAAIRKEGGDPNMTVEQAHRYRINKQAAAAAATKPKTLLEEMKRAGD